MLTDEQKSAIATGRNPCGCCWRSDTGGMTRFYCEKHKPSDAAENDRELVEGMIHFVNPNVTFPDCTPLP